MLVGCSVNNAYTSKYCTSEINTFTLLLALNTLHLKRSSSFEIKLKICRSWESCETQKILKSQKKCQPLRSEINWKCYVKMQYVFLIKLEPCITMSQSSFIYLLIGYCITSVSTQEFFFFWNKLEIWFQHNGYLPSQEYKWVR